MCSSLGGGFSCAQFLLNRKKQVFSEPVALLDDYLHHNPTGIHALSELTVNRT